MLAHWLGMRKVYKDSQTPEVRGAEGATFQKRDCSGREGSEQLCNGKVMHAVSTVQGTLQYSKNHLSRSGENRGQKAGEAQPSSNFMTSHLGLNSQALKAQVPVCRAPLMHSLRTPQLAASTLLPQLLCFRLSRRAFRKLPP